MPPSLTPAEAVDLLAADPWTTGIFSDFDGTLAAIVPDPYGAVPLPGVRELLVRLTRRLRLVGIVSGRPASFLVDCFRPGPSNRIELAGLHGLERWNGSEVTPVEPARPFAAAMAAAYEHAVAVAVPGLVVEDKGLALTLHWRAAAGDERVARAARSLALELAQPAGLQLRPGKASVELVPPVDVDKGTFVRESVAGLKTVAFLGDDTGDVKAFEALDALEQEGAVTAVRIAIGGDETPPELLELANLVLSGPEEAVRLLADLGDRLDDLDASGVGGVSGVSGVGGVGGVGDGS